MTEQTLPSEIVTRALLRDVDLPGGAGRMALITLDNGRDHTRPSTFGPAGLASLRAAVEQVAARADAGEIVAVGVTGKPFIFAAGADLTMVGAGRARDDALGIGRLGHDVFRRFGELAVPSFAFVNGAALGGGVELPLHCTYRTVSSGVGALALPECFLGLVPGWGGTYLLPNLVGPEKAVEVIIANSLNTNTMLNGPKAFALGMFDAIFEPADFLEQSLVWAGEVLTGRRQVERHAGRPRRAALGGRAQGRQEARGRQGPRRRAGAVPGARADAPGAHRRPRHRLRGRVAGAGGSHDGRRAAQLALRLRPRQPPGEEAGRRARQGARAAGDEHRRRRRRPHGEPARAAVRPPAAGAGRAHRPRPGPGRQGRRRTSTARSTRCARRSAISPDAANRLKALVTGSTSKDAFAEADLVIEAVFEELGVKKQVFAEVEAVVKPDCVLMTNTSSLSVTDMAADLEHPERVVGFHFFNPVAVLPLVEVVRAERTDDATLATAFAVGKELKKSCVLVKDAPAFVVNRLLTRFLGEVTRAVDEGTPVEVADRALAPLGLPMSPFVLLQLVGPAVALHVAETLHAAFPERYHVSENLRRLVEAGRAGIYSWDERGRPYVDDETKALLGAGRQPR